LLTPTAEAATPSPKFSPKNVIPFFSTTISGNQNDEIVGITSTKKNWVVAGNVVGDFLGTTSLGGVDSWVSAFDSSGANVWALRVGTSEDDLTTAIAVDSKEQIWIAGLAQSEKNPTALVAPESSSPSTQPQPTQPTQPTETPTVQTLNPDTVTVQTAV
jgi:hypothetical protein